MNEWKQQPIDNGNDDQMKEETLDLWNEEFQHQIDDDQKKKKWNNRWSKWLSNKWNCW